MRLRLGDGLAAEFGVAAKAALLDQAAVSGIAVPAGVIVVHGDDAAPSASLLPRSEAAPSALVVRSAFSAEDTTTTSMAGRFRTELGLPHDPEAIAQAVHRVRDSAAVSPGDDLDREIRTDVLVMAQVEALLAGVAFTEATFEDDLVNVTAGLGDQLVSGAVAGERTALAKLRRGERAASTCAPWEARLARVLQQVRAVFGPADWDIEWADDGSVCWLLQVRPITASPMRDEAFTVANHKEILPELPSTFMTSVIESCSRELLDFYRDMDASLPLDRDFVETFAGRPYLNLSMLTDLMRALGLPTHLVTDSYGGEPDVAVGLRPGRLVRSAPTLLRIGAAQGRAVPAAEAAGERIERLGAATHDSFGSAVDSFRAAYLLLVNEMGALASSLAPPVALLRRAGVLDEHLARHRTAATTMLDDLAELSALAADPAVADHFARGELGDRQDVAEAWSRWAEHHGHRGVFESDVARPRFSEDPAPILRAATGVLATATTAPSRSIRGRLTAPLWWAARAPLSAREQLRSRAMRGFAGVRSELTRLAGEAVEDGRLTHVAALWSLTAEEVRTLDRGAHFDEADIAARQTERSRLEALRLPDTVHRFDDVEREVADHGGRTSIDGLSLVRGEVTGRAWRCSEPPTELPEGFSPDTTILVARSVDAGWVPIFNRVAGVAVEIGGDLSHGSIILRELGVPSITNVGDLGTSVVTGDAVVLDATRGRLRLAQQPAGVRRTAGD